MLPSIEYATLLQYHPRGQAEASVKSRSVRDTIKNGQIAPYKDRLAEIIAQHRIKLMPFLHPGVTLVPTPRSSPLKGASLWPAQEIAELLQELRVGTIASCLVRETAVRKSALFSKGDERPSIAEHYTSFGIHGLAETASITLVDDVVTLGRTLIAAASRLHDAFPNATIRAFALMQTRGRSDEVDIDSILHVHVGTITYNEISQKCRRT